MKQVIKNILSILSIMSTVSYNYAAHDPIGPKYNRAFELWNKPSSHKKDYYVTYEGQTKSLPPGGYEAPQLNEIPEGFSFYLSDKENTNEADNYFKIEIFGRPRIAFIRINDEDAEKTKFGPQTGVGGGIGGFFKGHPHGVSASGFMLRGNVIADQMIMYPDPNKDFENGLFKIIKEADKDIKDSGDNLQNTIETVRESLTPYKEQINDPIFLGWTPLHQAVYYGNPALVRLLLKLGVNIHQENALGHNAGNLAEILEKYINSDERAEVVRILRDFAISGIWK